MTIAATVETAVTPGERELSAFVRDTSPPIAGAESLSVPGYAPERNGSLQKFLSNVLRGIDADHTIDGFDIGLSSLVARTEHVDTSRVIQNGNKAAQPMASNLLGMPQPASPSSESSGVQSLAAKTEMAALIVAAEPVAAVWKPTEKLDASRPSGNMQGNRIEGENKAADAQAKMAEFKANAIELAQKSGQLAAEPSAGKDHGGMSGAVMREATIGLGLTMIPVVGPVIGPAYTAMNAMGALMGKGTLVTATQQGPSEFDSKPTDRRGRPTESAFASSGGSSSAPQTMAVASSFADRMNNAPGFGAYIKSGADGASGTLQGITKIQLEKELDKSEPMVKFQTQLVDANAVLKIHETMKDKGLETTEGKPTLAPPQLEIARRQPQLVTFMT